MCPSSGLWRVLDCDSRFTILIPLSFDGPQFHAPWACVPLYISLHVDILPSVLPRSLYGWPRKSLHLLEEGQIYTIVRFAYLCHMIGEEFVIPKAFLLVHQAQASRLDLEVEVTFNNRSAVTHHKMYLLKFPLRSSCSECTNNAFVLIICFCFFHV